MAAGYILLEELRSEARDPLADLLQTAGVMASFRLLTTGQIDEGSLGEYALIVLTRTARYPADETIIARFEEVRIASSPLAYEIDITGETTLTLIEADPFRQKSYPALLSDADWVGLQAICGG